MIKGTKNKKEKEDEGMSLDDAFGDDEDVEYGETKARKIVKKEKIGKAEEIEGDIKIKASKDISKLKKGEKVKVDALVLEIDAHYVLIDHGSTKEMVIECFDARTEKDYQIRYFTDNFSGSLEVYELEEIVYNRMNVKKVEW